MKLKVTVSETLTGEAQAMVTEVTTLEHLWTTLKALQGPGESYAFVQFEEEESDTCTVTMSLTVDD